VTQDPLVHTDSADPALAKLRSELSTLLDLEWADQIARVETLRAIYPHSIRSIPAGSLQDRIRQFKCFAYAFQLWRLRGLFDLTESRAVIFDDTLVNAMVAELHSKPRHDAVNQDLVIYSTDTGIVHAGMVSGQDVRSKWGTSYIWDHGTFEIPAEYGRSARYFAAPPPEVTTKRFLFHAERQIAAGRGEHRTDDSGD
jgi:hypothetical protein